MAVDLCHILNGRHWAYSAAREGEDGGGREVAAEEGENEVMQLLNVGGVDFC